MSEYTSNYGSRLNRLRTIVASISVGAMLLAPVHAQELMLEEIVVTARKRTESVQDIPESITVFSESGIADSGITRIKDVADLTPNLVVRQSYRLGVVNLSARGLATPQQGDSPLVVNFDGVQAPAQDFINQDLFDIERIEVLKGPQGALYGAGAIGGAINVITKRPTNELDAFTRLSVGNENARRIAAGISGPIAVDRVFYRLAGVVQNRDGYIRNSLTGDLLDFLDETVLRGGLFFTLDKLNIDLRASVTDTGAGASYYEAMPLLADPVPEIDQLFGGPLGRLGSDISYGSFDNHSNVQTEEERDVTTASLRVEYQLDGGTFTSITGYNDSRQYDYGDLDFQPADILLQDVRFDVEVFNQEFRYASDPDQRFRWVGGVFYQDREIFNQVLVVLGDFTVGPRTIQESMAQPGNSLLTDTRDVIESQAVGVFLSTNYDITGRLELTAAARWDQVDMNTRFVGQDPNLINLPNASSARQFDEFQPKLNLAYTVNENATIYGDLARGFRTGVPNPTSAFAGGLPRFIEPEVADTLELGVKSTFFNDRASLNAAVFHSSVENRHHYFYGAALQSMTTYDEAEISGLEVDFEGLLSDHLRFSASLGVMNAEITSDEITEYLDFTTGDVALVVNNRGNTLPDTPETSYNLALTYERPMLGVTNFFGRVAYAHVDEMFFDTENYIRNAGASDFVNLRLGLRNDRWDAVLFGDNLTDERNYSNYAYSGGAGNYLPNQPRTYGIEVQVRL